LGGVFGREGFQEISIFYNIFNILKTPKNNMINDHIMFQSHLIDFKKKTKTFDSVVI